MSIGLEPICCVNWMVELRNGGFCFRLLEMHEFVELTVPVISDDIGRAGVGSERTRSKELIVFLSF